MERASTTEPVSVLIPVCGVDGGAPATWESFCCQQYPVFEVLFGVMDARDPAVPLLQQLAAKFPERVRVVHCAKALGCNHQISNLIHLLREAQHEWIIIADSDIKVGPGYLQTVTRPLKDPACGVVTCGYVAHQPASLGAALASLDRCVDFIPQVLIARWLDRGLKFAIGPTIATRKQVIADFGGLERVVNRIGSDYHIGQMAADVGYRVELSGYIVENDNGPETIGQVFRRELRWARTIRLNRGPEYYGLVVQHGTVFATLLLLVTGGQAWAVVLFLLVAGMRLTQAVMAIHSLRCPGLLRWLWALPLRDVLTFVVWSISLFGDEVSWRGRRLRLRRGGLLENLPAAE